ncbi:MAG: M28 family peptidase [Bacilli bacterium]
MRNKIIFTLASIIMLLMSVVLLNPSEIKYEQIDYDKYYEMLEELSKEERSLNHPYHDISRDYLVDELEARGLEVSLINSEEDEVIYKDDGEVFEYGVSNIYATLKANNPSENKKNIAFVSHYDSAVGSYGAGDAGLAVISFFAGLDSIIEQARVNDITILITDHEESGLIGANYIADYHPELLEQIDFLYNWESRGTGGNVILFETTENDYQAVKNYSKVVKQQFAASFATAVYGRMPNGSDFTVFKESGVEGLNFAMIEQFADYHTKQDHIDNIPKETFNNYINNVEQLMVDSAINDFTIKSTSSSVYFNYFDKAIVVNEYVVSVMLVVSILLLGYIIFMEKDIELKYVAFTILAVIISFIIANLLALIPISIFERFSEYKPPQETDKIRFDLIYNNFYAIFMYAILLASMLGITKLFEKKNLISRRSMFIVALTIGVILELVVFKALYGGVIIFMIPVLVMEIVYILRQKIKTELVNLLLILILIPVFYPIVYYIYIALTVNAYAILINVLVIFTLFFMHLHLNNEK